MSFAQNLVRPLKSSIYSDANLYINGANQSETVLDEDSINNSILTILNTPIGSRVFNREFGSDINSILFDPMDGVTERRIRREIIDALSRWETRISLTTANVIADYPNSQYYVELEYLIPSLNNRNVTLKFNLTQAQS